MKDDKNHRERVGTAALHAIHEEIPKDWYAIVIVGNDVGFYECSRFDDAGALRKLRKVVEYLEKNIHSKAA
jgi:hypothetical protein